MLHIISALHVEAKPLINCFQLKKLTQYPLFEIYSNKSESITLTISGIGKLNASAATMYTSGIYSNEKDHCWVNIGIAGHESMDIGTLFIANKIIDSGSKQSWYPQLIFPTDTQKSALITVDSPTDDYPVDHAIDMEASGFYSATARVSTFELTHCLKIISDNEANNLRSLNKQKIESLVQSNIGLIESIMNQLKALNNDLKQVTYDTTIYQEIISGTHFTHAEKLHLQKALIKWKILIPDVTPDVEYCNKLKIAKRIINHLSCKIDEIPVNF